MKRINNLKTFDNAKKSKHWENLKNTTKNVVSSIPFVNNSDKYIDMKQVYIVEHHL